MLVAQHVSADVDRALLEVTCAAEIALRAKCRGERDWLAYGLGRKTHAKQPMPITTGTFGVLR